jgi:predicted acylesterase/phospholipase RssA
MQLRCSLTISGAVALGAYEAGAIAGLLYALRPLASGPDPSVTVDVIAGASAGSMVGLLAARTLLEGLDPLKVMQAAWVDDDGIGQLRSHDTAAPLSMDYLREMATSLLDPPGDRDQNRQPTQITLSFVLACLRGLDYTIPALRATRPIGATTYVDFFDTALRPGMSVNDIIQPAQSSMLDAVLASAANAMGFPPYLIDRESDADAYRFVSNFPPQGMLWMTDGGTLNNEPLGRTLDLANAADRAANDDARRLHVLIHPHPTGSPTGGAWADPQARPTWVETLGRALSLQRTQSLFTDLKQVEKTNSHLSWADDLVNALTDALCSLPEDARAQVSGSLSKVVGEQRAQRAALSKGRTDAASAEPEVVPVNPDHLGDLLAEAVATVADVGGKRPSAVEVISPVLVPPEPGEDPVPVEQLLSGELLFHFGGFLDRDLRMADFDLGYVSILAWLRQGALTNSGGLPVELSEQAEAAARAAYTPGDSFRRLGPTTVGGLSAMSKLQLLRLTAHIAHVVEAGARAGRTQH